ncbi:MAG: NUDIX domain-containing protein [Chloroflexota bacterium]
MEEKHVVVVFLESDGRIALWRRSDRVGHYRGCWAGIAGYLEPGANPLQQAMVEITEEAGLQASEVELVGTGEVVEVVDPEVDRKWLVHPFLFRTTVPGAVRLDWEHVDLKWITPSELDRFETVPGLRAAWASVASDSRL